MSAENIPFVVHRPTSGINWPVIFDTVSMTDADRERVLKPYTKLEAGRILGLHDCYEGFDLVSSRLPEKVGEHMVRADFFATYTDEKGEPGTIRVEGAATLTLEHDTPPNLPCPAALKGVTIFKVTRTNAEDGEADFIEDEDGTRTPIEIRSECTVAWVIPKDEFDAKLRHAYGVNLDTVQAATAFFKRDAWYPDAMAIWGQLCKSIVPKAFGVEEESVQFGMCGPVSLGDIPSRTYYDLDGAVLLLALLELRKSGDIRLTLPPPDCLIRMEPAEKLSDEAEIVYFEEVGKPYPPVKFAPEGRGRVPRRAKLAEIVRLGEETLAIESTKAQIQVSAYKTFAASGKPSNPDPKSSQDVVGLLKQIHGNRKKIVEGYIELANWAAQHTRKEEAIRKIRKFASIERVVQTDEEALRDFADTHIHLPNNFYGLPAHFAAVPTGLSEGFHMELTADDLNREILKVQRENFALPGIARRSRPDMSITLGGNNNFPDKSVMGARLQRLFGPGGATWLVAQGMVALAKMYRDGGGYNGNGVVVRIHLRDWVAVMRPSQVERFKKKGISEAFTNYNPKDAFIDLLAVLEGITYEYVQTQKKWSQLRGFFLIPAIGEDERGFWAEIEMNPSLLPFIMGDGGLPYMASNTRAMFSYSAQSLAYGPSSQMALEQFARINLYDRNTTTLSTPKGDGIERDKLAYSFGLLAGPNERASHIVKRVDRILDGMGEAGVITGWKVDGRDRKDLRDKLLIDMHDDYRRAYNLTKHRNMRDSARKDLERPFALPRKRAKGDEESGKA